MDFSAAISGSELERLRVQVDSFNTALGGSREASESLDKDDFMKILITQLTHQDPTKPMEDKAFIAQMAQFSTLEQMSNMSQEFSTLKSVMMSNQAYSLLGRNVTVADGEQIVTGVVEEVVGREYPQLLVGGKYYDFSQVEAVKR
jgi:flagellar basal-body rod modification protein FlgD